MKEQSKQVVVDAISDVLDTASALHGLADLLAKADDQSGIGETLGALSRQLLSAGEIIADREDAFFVEQV